MVTRVRIEAEGRTPDEVVHTLETAHQKFIVEGDRLTLETLFGPPDDGAYPGLVDAQAGECVLERVARDGEPGVKGQLFWRGRMTAHFAPAGKTIDLRERTDATVAAGAEFAPAQ